MKQKKPLEKLDLDIFKDEKLMNSEASAIFGGAVSYAEYDTESNGSISCDRRLTDICIDF